MLNREKGVKRNIKFVFRVTPVWTNITNETILIKSKLFCNKFFLITNQQINLLVCSSSMLSVNVKFSRLSILKLKPNKNPTSNSKLNCALKNLMLGQLLQCESLN